MPISNITQLSIKEFRSLLRDPIMIALILFAFSIAIYSAATAMPETLTLAPIAIVNEDHSLLSDRIFDAFYPPNFKPPLLISKSAMDKGMDMGNFTFVLDIPPNFQRDLMANKIPSLQLNVDATNMNQAVSGTGYIQSIISGEIQTFLNHHREQNKLPVDLSLRLRFNQEMNQRWFAAVNELINNITMLSIVLTGAALLREREHGTIDHLLAMPITPFEIMTSKVLSMSLIVLITCALSLLIVVHGFLGLPIHGSILLFFLAVSLNLFATTSLGIFMGIVTRSMPQFGLLLIMSLLPLEMLSGGITPRESMPELLRLFMLLAPTTHFVMLSKSILFRGAGITLVWQQLLALFGIGYFFFYLTLKYFRRAIA